MAENSFVMYKDWEIIVNSLDSDKEVADLFRGIFAYACRGEEMEGTTGALKMAFAIISSQLKRDNEKWEKTVAARIAAGKVGGQAKQANAKGAKQNKQKVTNLPVNVNVNDNVNVNGLGVNSPPTPPQENSHNFYSEYKNVGLTDSQYQSLLGLTQSTQALNLIIEEFASAIETGKENAFTYELPNAHFERLKQFWKWRKKHPPKQDVPKLSSYEDFYNYLTGLPKDEVQIE